MRHTIFIFALLSILGHAGLTAIADEPTRFSVFAGTGKSAPPAVVYSPGQPSGGLRSINLGTPFGIEVRGTKIWFTTIDDQCIYQGSTEDEALVRVAGSGTIGFSGDQGSATDAAFDWPHEVRSDSVGNLYVADTRNNAIRRIDATSGIITTIAGGTAEGFAGDGQSGDVVQFRQPHSVALEGDDALLVADTINHRLRRIDLKTLIVETVAGNGQAKMPTDGADAKESSLFGPRSLAVDETSIWVALREGNSIWRIDRRDHTIHHIAGTGKKGYDGDGGSPKLATFNGPKGLSIDGRSRLLVADTENHSVRRIDLVNDKIETVVGGSAADATFPLKRPHGICAVGADGFLVADSEHHRVIWAQ